MLTSGCSGAANTNTAVDGCAAGDPGSAATDVIVLGPGVYDITGLNMPPVTGSVTLTGSGIGSTIVKGGSLYLSLSDGATSITHDISFEDMYIAYTADTPVTVATLDIHAVSLLSSRLELTQLGDSRLTTTASNVTGTRSYIRVKSDSSSPGDTTLSNITLDGNGAPGEAITHINARANDKTYVNNSVITNYATGLSNQECQVGGYMNTVTSLYVSNSSIGGGNMTTGINNTCGHLVVDATTFHDISGQAIYAEVNHASFDAYTMNGELVSLTCYPQSSSRLEITNSTFTGITPQIVGPQPAAVISLGAASQSYPTCPVPSLTTTSSLSMKQNTIAGNTLGTSSDIFISDGVALDSVTLQNNALEGRAELGTFTVTTSTSSFGNMTTSPYAGPSLLAGAFKSVSTFHLGALANNGGRAKIGYLGGGGDVLTMRPTWESPLIDGSTDAGLAVDERNSARSLLLKYDVGAVEVTKGEVLSDGITLDALNAYLGTSTTSATTPSLLASTGANSTLAIAIALAGVLFGLLIQKKSLATRK